MGDPWGYQLYFHTNKSAPYKINKQKSDLSNKSLNIKDEIIFSQNEVESLGVIIDNKLSFREHIKTLYKNAAGKLNALKRLGSYLNEETRKYYTNAYVISAFNYSSLVWHFCGLTEIHRMEKVHQRAIRFIYDDQTTAYHQLLDTHDLATLYTKRLRLICCEIYKTKHQLNPGYIKDILAPRPSSYPSRKLDDLYVPSANQQSFGYNSFRIERPKLWNTLPDSVKNAKDIDTFKLNIKKVKLPSCRCNKECVS